MKDKIQILTCDKIKEIVQTIAPKYDISCVYLFGSYANGSATENSDFDFRIVGGNVRSLYDLAAIKLDLEEALGNSVDVLLTENIRDSFREAIKNEEILLYGKI